MDPVAYLLGLETIGIKLGLETIGTLAAALGHPERSAPSVLVAGTNGKGSVAAMLDAILSAAGLRTGRYTSPHLVRLEERFAVGGRPVASEAFRAAAADLQRLVAALRARGDLPVEPTFFEVTTAIGFELFRRAGVDLLVLEVGMGGRWDATNIVTPIAGAITTIDFDHETFLGHTLAAIAFEKAGIIKPGMTVVVGETKREPLEVITRVAAEQGARVVLAADDVRIEERFESGRATIDVTTPVRTYGPVTLGLRGRHQAHNAVVAIRLAEALAEAGVPIDDTSVARGLAATRWPGRLDLVEAGGGRRVLVDAAHNPAGARALAEYLAEVHPSGLPVVFGVMRDKHADAMLAALRPHATRIVMTEPPTRRAAPAPDLVALASRLGYGATAEAEPDPARALERAFRYGDTVLVAGSIFLAGALLPQIERSRQQAAGGGQQAAGGEWARRRG